MENNLIRNIISQREFAEALKHGKREFSGALMQFLDVFNLKLADVVFKKCKLLFCTFRSCEFKNVAFEDCTIYFGSFYTGSADNLIFEKSSIEMTLFDTFQFSDTKMKNCNIRWCGIINSNASAVDTHASSCYKFITDISQLSAKDVEEIVGESMLSMGRLDIGIKMKLKEILRLDMKRYGITNPEDKEGGGYSKQGTEYKRENLTYGEVRAFIETAFGAYGPKPVYTNRKTEYEMKDVYKSK